jgi:hypothetical protein
MGAVRRFVGPHIPLNPAGESGESTSPAPKEQPPRKLSGLQDRGAMELWKAIGGADAAGSPKE